MKSSKSIDISKSSLISLKAELSRKQDEVAKAKLQNQTSVIRPIARPKKQTIWTKQNAGVSERNEKDAEQLQEERDMHELSRGALEAKSKLYEKLSKSAAASDSNSVYLVDFQQKAAEGEKEEEEEEVQQTYSDEPASDPEDDWVDYEDCLGRTRRCLRRDLEFIKQKDAHLSATLFDKPSAPDNEQPELQSADMRRELLRQKWEEQEERLRDKSDIHYQDVLFDEARSHGVGYYGFSQDETERKSQQEALSRLRQETHKQQEAAKDLRNRRQQQLQARLKAARRRKRARLGLPEVDSEEETEEASVAPEPSEEEVKPEEPAETERKVLPVRPWDIGKKGVPQTQLLSQEEWVAKKRDERPQDFAPPSSYQSDTKPSLYFTSKRQKKNSEIINEAEQPRAEVAPPAAYSPAGRAEFSRRGTETVYLTEEQPGEHNVQTWKGVELPRRGAETAYPTVQRFGGHTIQPLKGAEVPRRGAETAYPTVQGFGGHTMQPLKGAELPRRGAEIAPPTVYGPGGHIIQPLKGAELEHSITAGLRYLRQQAEQRQKHGDRGMLDPV